MLPEPLMLPNELQTIKNLAAANEEELQHFVKMHQRMLQFQERYQGKEISGYTFANLADNSFEVIYYEDIKNNACFPLEYFAGVFMSVDYDKTCLTDALDTTKLVITKIKLIGTFSPDDSYYRHPDLLASYRGF